VTGTVAAARAGGFNLFLCSGDTEHRKTAVEFATAAAGTDEVLFIVRAQNQLLKLMTTGAADKFSDRHN